MPGEPNAPAVVLFRNGELQMAGFGLRSAGMASSLRLQVRLKILTEEGKSNGEVSISHSGFERLHGFKGRTVLPDGRVLPIPSDARFVRKTSRSRKTYLTLYRFVRDQVANDGYVGAWVDPDHTLGAVLSDHKGSRAEKALLLQRMLDAVDVPSRLVWAANRDNGAVDLELPNPAWFDTVLVRVELDARPVFLDPNDRTLAFGHLRAGHEGTPAILFDPKKPETLTLPETPYDQNLQRAEIDLTLDAQGRLAGAGSLRLSGQQAWEKIGLEESQEKAVQSWKEWLEKRYRDFQVSGVKVVESPDDETMTVTWSLAQREEEGLGDEASLTPSVPVGPQKQPFIQPASSRRSGVLFDYPYRDEVELKLHWPEGWKLSVRPTEEIKITPAGRLSTEMEVHETDRLLVYRRQVDLTRREIKGSQDYESLRAFFGAVEKHDAQKLVLAKR